jgi:hypothetical protein
VTRLVSGELRREDKAMRALCGAIITAGAVIGLGITAVGFSGRYHAQNKTETDTKVSDKPAKSIDVSFPHPDKLHEVDKPLFVIMVFLILVALTGLAIAFVGLAYHHHRRYHEHLREEQRLAAQQRTPV